MRQHAGVFAANFSSNLLWQNCFAPKKSAFCAEPRRVAAGILDVCQGGATMGLRQTRLLRRMFSYARRPKAGGAGVCVRLWGWIRQQGFGVAAVAGFRGFGSGSGFTGRTGRGFGVVGAGIVFVSGLLSDFATAVGGIRCRGIRGGGRAAGVSGWAAGALSGTGAEPPSGAFCPSWARSACSSAICSPL